MSLGYVGLVFSIENGSWNRLDVMIVNSIIHWKEMIKRQMCVSNVNIRRCIALMGEHGYITVKQEIIYYEKNMRTSNPPMNGGAS